MKKPKRHLIAASILLLLFIFLYFIKIIDWKIEILLLVALFPYFSFSLILLNAGMQKKKDAIDVIKRKYPS